MAFAHLGTMRTRHDTYMGIKEIIRGGRRAYTQFINGATHTEKKHETVFGLVIEHHHVTLTLQSEFLNHSSISS